MTALMSKVEFHHSSSAKDATQQLLPRAIHQEEVHFEKDLRKP